MLTLDLLEQFKHYEVQPLFALLPRQVLEDVAAGFFFLLGPRDNTLDVIRFNDSRRLLLLLVLRHSLDRLRRLQLHPLEQLAQLLRVHLLGQAKASFEVDDEHRRSISKRRQHKLLAVLISHLVINEALLTDALDMASEEGYSQAFLEEPIQLHDDALLSLALHFFCALVKLYEQDGIF